MTRNELGSVLLEPQGGDNLGIALATYFEKHMDRPRDDPDDENGWSLWVLDKTHAALDLILAEMKRSHP